MKNNTKLIMESWRSFLKESDDLILDDEGLERDNFQDDVKNLENNLGGNNKSENVDLSQWEEFVSRYNHEEAKNVEEYLHRIWNDCWEDLSLNGMNEDEIYDKCDEKINNLIKNHDANFIKNYTDQEHDLRNDGFEGEYREDGGESGYGYDYDHGLGQDEPSGSGIEFMKRFKR